jgi:hypothetical protein
MAGSWWWDLLLGIAGLLLAWVVLIVALVIVRPRGGLLREALRLLPDVLRLLPRLAADRRRAHPARRIPPGDESDPPGYEGVMITFWVLPVSAAAACPRSVTDPGGSSARWGARWPLRTARRRRCRQAGADPLVSALRVKGGEVIARDGREGAIAAPGAVRYAR